MYIYIYIANKPIIGLNTFQETLIITATEYSAICTKSASCT